MRTCLNPGTSHKNYLSGDAVEHAEADEAAQQVFCRYCRYLLDGTLLGDCRVVRWIGSGTFGDVYEAEQLPPLKRRVALKVMATEHISDGHAADLFAREVSAIAAMDHPHILPVLRVGQIAGSYPYLVMKYAAHGSLLQFTQPPASVVEASISLEQSSPAEEPASLTPLTDDTLLLSESSSLSSTPVSHETQQEAKTAILPPIPESSLPFATSSLLPIPTENPHDTPPIHTPPIPDESDTIISPIENQSVFSDNENTQEATQPSLAHLSVMQEATLLPVNVSIEAEAETPAVNECVEEVIQSEQAQNFLPASPPPADFSGPKSSILTPQQLLPFLEQTASALQYAHDHGIIHLDVKPANLLLDAEDRVLLADFGVSVLIEGYTHASLRGYVGTPLYTAPEQWLEQPRPASDQYALGVTCYQLLTGRVPFTGNLYSIMHGHIKLAPPPLREFQPLIPEEVEQVILHSLAKEPTERYPDVRSFALAYRSALELSANASTDVHAMNSIVTIAQDLARSRISISEDLELSAKQGFLSEQMLPLLPASDSPEQVLSSRQLPSSGIDTSPPPMSLLKRVRWPSKNARMMQVALLLCVFLLLSSLALGTIYVVRPCWLGRCPRLVLDTRTLNFVNNDQKSLHITNTGNENLNWSITGSPVWLRLSLDHGVVSPQSSVVITLNSYDSGSATANFSAVLHLVGNAGISQDINVSMQVASGLDAIESKISATSLAFIQGSIKPPTQTITLTNKSGSTLSWWTMHTDNNWLVVSPGQGSLPDGKTTTAIVTVNFANLVPNIYEARVDLNGKLPDGRLRLLNSFELTLTVSSNLTPVVAPTPTFTFPTYTPQQLSAPTLPPTLRSGHSMAWDDRDNLLFVFGGVDDKSNFLNDLWSYNPQVGVWKQLSGPTNMRGDSCGPAPASRINTAMVWDSADQQLLLYGGLGPNNTYFDDLWSFSPSNANWNVLQCHTTGGPGPRSSNAVWNGHQMLLLGGLNSGGLLADFWSYAPGNGNVGWQKISSTTPIQQRTYQSMAWDTLDRRLYVFGGLDTSGMQQSDFWSYDTTNGWFLIKPASTNNPQARQQAMMTWDSLHNVLLMMGGWQDALTAPYYALWSFNPKQNAWGQLTPMDSSNNNIIPARTAACMVWDTKYQRAYIYAGAGNDKSHSSLNDFWIIH